MLECSARTTLAPARRCASTAWWPSSPVTYTSKPGARSKTLLPEPAHTATRRIVANVLVDARPRFAQFKHDSSEVWVSAEIGGTVTLIDPVKFETRKKIGFEIPGMRKEAIQPVGIAITRDGKTAFVALGPANRVAVVNAATHEVQKYLLVGQRVWQMAFTPDEKLLFVTNGVSNDVSVIDVATLRVIKSIAVGELPWGVAISQE